MLMANAPTVGGYPKIAVVSKTDMPILAQRSPGASVRFELITIEQSQRALKRRASDQKTRSAARRGFCIVKCIAASITRPELCGEAASMEGINGEGARPNTGSEQTSFGGQLNADGEATVQLLRR